MKVSKLEYDKLININYDKNDEYEERRTLERLLDWLLDNVEVSEDE